MIDFKFFLLYIKKFIVKIKKDNKQKKIIQEEIFFYNKKLGVSYNVFDGIELLESSIKSIRKNVDYINVVFQTVSNYGEEAENNSIKILNRLKTLKLIDNIIIYHPDLNISSSLNELKKRQTGLEDCLRHKCTYFLNMDTDEYYLEDQFFKAKMFIFKNNISCSACQMYYYIKSPNYKFIEPRRSTYVPFICRINNRTKLEFDIKSFCLVDPTRMVSSKGRIWMFAPDFIAMHHMAFVRKDLEKKFRNSSYNACKEGKKINENIKNNVLYYEFPNDFYFYGEGHYKIEYVDDIFNIKNYIKE